MTKYIGRLFMPEEKSVDKCDLCGEEGNVILGYNVDDKTYLICGKCLNKDFTISISLFFK